jgi:hypothetical protein
MGTPHSRLLLIKVEMVAVAHQEERDCIIIIITLITCWEITIPRSAIGEFGIQTSLACAPLPCSPSLPRLWPDGDSLGETTGNLTIG